MRTRLSTLALPVYTALLLGLLAAPGTARAQSQTPPSSYAKSPGGTKVLYLFLQDLGYRMRRIFDIRELKGNATTPAANVALMVGPVGKRSARIALEWARAGRLLVIAPALVEAGRHCGSVSFSKLTIERELRPLGDVAKVNTDDKLKLRNAACVLNAPPTARVLASTYATKTRKGRGSKKQGSKKQGSKKQGSKKQGSKKQGSKKQGSKKQGGTQTGQSTSALIFEHDVGKGKVLVLAHDGLLTNDELDRDDLAVVLRRWLQVNTPLRAQVAYYEVRQGGALWKMLKRAKLTTLFFHGLVLLLLVLWKITPRFGDADAFSPSRRRAFAEHARSLGTLYQRAGSSGYALSLLYERFQRRLRYRGQGADGKRANPRGAAGVQERAALAQRLATRTGTDADSIESLLAQVEYAAEQKQSQDSRGVMRDYRLAVGLCDLARKAGIGEIRD